MLHSACYVACYVHTFTPFFDVSPDPLVADEVASELSPVDEMSFLPAGAEPPIEPRFRGSPSDFALMSCSAAGLL